MGRSKEKEREMRASEIAEALETPKVLETPEEKPAPAIRAAKKERLIYVGPTLKKPPLVQNTVYNGIPEAAEKAMEGCRELKILFIPLDKYSIAEEQIRTGKGAYYAAFNAVNGL